MNDILDFLNGLIEKHEIKDVNVHQREFSRENIDKYVKRGLVEVINDEILLTGIHTEGGKLLQDNVLLVDMAGFDGANANFESLAYKAIVKRADLIVFVQSSNSAISKVSSDFFDLLRENNHSVPVCLVHNVFEAAYWRADELIRQDIEMQKEYAIDTIRDNYRLALDPNYAFNLNLGKVDDFRENKYTKDKDVLGTEAEAFENAEGKMYELFKKRESIRLRNCITRTKIHKNKLLEAIIALQDKQDALREKYESIKVEFDNLKKTDMSLDFNVIVSLDDLIRKVKQVYYAIKETEVTFSKYRTNEARTIVQKFLDEVENKMNDYLHLKQNEVCSTINSNSEKLQQWLTEVHNARLKYGIMGEFKMSFCVEPENVTYDIGDSVESKVPQKPFAYKHTADEVNDYLKVFKNRLLGFLEEHEMVMVPGCVEKIYAEIQRIINGSIEKARASIIFLVNNEIERQKLQVLQNVIPSIEKFEANYESLKKFKQNVQNLNIHDITL